MYRKSRLKFSISILGNRLFSCISTVGFLTISAGIAHAMPTKYQTGVTIYDPALAYHSDILFSPMGEGKHLTYLINMHGDLVHQWPYVGFPPKMIDPSLMNGEKGVIGVQLSSLSANGKQAQTDVVPGQPSVFLDKTFGYVGWNNQILWKWGTSAPHGVALQHHDYDRLKDGSTLILSNLKRVIPGFGSKPVLDDVIYEVSPAGKIVWRWSALDHLDQFGFSPKQIAIIKKSHEPDVLHVNDMEVLGKNKWEENGDTRFAPDNILISSRNGNFTVIIDRKTGNVVWRIGPNYPRRQAAGLGPDKLPRPIDQISGQHGGYMIPEGLPGAGDILMLDNQGEAGFPHAPLSVLAGSRVLEINPVTKQIVWEYNARDSGNMAFSFYTPFIGNAQRLPNGNTLIDEGIDGRFFQVTPEGKIVWEYVSPYLGRGPGAPIAGRPPVMSNWVYRVQSVPYSWVPHDTQATQ